MKYRIVPETPTSSMFNEGATELQRNFPKESLQARAGRVYEAMLEAAPKPDDALVEKARHAIAEFSPQCRIARCIVLDESDESCMCRNQARAALAAVTEDSPLDDSLRAHAELAGEPKG